MQIIVKCPACNSDSSFFIAKPVFEGPFRCWKCQALYTLKARNGNMGSSIPIPGQTLSQRIRMQKRPLYLLE